MPVMQELEMLSHAISMPDEERHKPLPPPPADLLGELHRAASNLGGQRQQIASQVFRPSHRLPTRTLQQQVLAHIALLESWEIATMICCIRLACFLCLEQKYHEFLQLETSEQSLHYISMMLM